MRWEVPGEGKLGRGGYLGGSTIIRVGFRGMRWGDEASVGSPAGPGPKPKPKPKAKPTQPKSKPKAASKKTSADAKLAKRAASEGAYLHQLARMQIFGVAEPPKPKALVAEIERAGGVIPWVNKDSKRKDLFTESYTKLKADRDRALGVHLSACASASQRGDLTAASPAAPKKLRQEIAEAGGNLSWLKATLSRMQKFREIGGVLRDAVGPSQVARAPEPERRSQEMHSHSPAPEDIAAPHQEQAVEREVVTVHGALTPSAIGDAATRAASVLAERGCDLSTLSINIYEPVVRTRKPRWYIAGEALPR